MNTFTYPNKKASAEEAIAHYRSEEARLNAEAALLPPLEAEQLLEEAYAAGSIAAKYKFFPDDWYAIRGRC